MSQPADDYDDHPRLGQVRRRPRQKLRHASRRRSVLFVNEVLVAWPTDFDADLTALANIFEEWTSGSSYSDRILHLTGTAGGLNGTTFLSEATVHDDGVKDVLTGGKGTDWFVVSVPDKLELKAGEQKLTV
jgi:hypothetical protein